MSETCRMPARCARPSTVWAHRRSSAFSTSRPSSSSPSTATSRRALRRSTPRSGTRVLPVCSWSSPGTRFAFSPWLASRAPATTTMPSPPVLSRNWTPSPTRSRSGTSSTPPSRDASGSRIATISIPGNAWTRFFSAISRRRIRCSAVPVCPPRQPRRCSFRRCSSPISRTARSSARSTSATRRICARATSKPCCARGASSPWSASSRPCGRTSTATCSSLPAPLTRTTPDRTSTHRIWRFWRASVPGAKRCMGRVGSTASGRTTSSTSRSS